MERDMTWAPPSINIPGEKGTPDLDIMSTFALEFEQRSPGDCSESVACGKCSQQSPIVRFK